MKARLQSFFKTNYDIRVNCLFVYSVPKTLNALINVYKLINKTGSIEARTVFTELRGQFSKKIHNFTSTWRNKTIRTRLKTEIVIYRNFKK